MVAAKRFGGSLAATIMTTAVVIAVRPISSRRPSDIVTSVPIKIKAAIPKDVIGNNKR